MQTPPAIRKKIGLKINNISSTLSACWTAPSFLTAGQKTFFSGIGLINKTSLLLSKGGLSKDKYHNWGYIIINNQKLLFLNQSWLN